MPNNKPQGILETQEALTQVGKGVDSSGGPVVDPTENVKALNEAAAQRQDDLRAYSERYLESKVLHVEQMAALRGEFTNKLAEAEAKRIDAIRAVDVNAVAVASERQAAAATVLANQVASSADALRTLVATTAAAMAEQQRQNLSQITDRLTVVERFQYEGHGKSTVNDPMMNEMIAELKSLRESRATGSGSTKGSQAMWAYVVGGVGFLGVIISIIMNFVK